MGRLASWWRATGRSLATCSRYSLSFLGKNRSLIMSVTYPLALLVIFLWKPKLPKDFKTSEGTKKFYEDPTRYAPQKGAYLLFLMAGFWVTECLPLPITSLLPIVLLPLFGVSNCDEIASKYLSQTNLFLVGGCILALAFEYSRLNTRIALKVVCLVGAKIPAILLGVMTVTMFLSMFMSNTSTTSMIIPIANVIVEEFANAHHTAHSKKTSGPSSSTSITATEVKQKEIRNIKCLFFIATAFAANIGGTGLQTGTSTNIIAVEELKSVHSRLANLKTLKNKEVCLNALEISFGTWFLFAVIPLVLNILMVWAYLQLYFLGIPSYLKFWRKKTAVEIAFIQQEKEAAVNIAAKMKKQYTELGRISFHEAFILGVFIITILLWVFRHPIFILGWGDPPLFPANLIDDATATLLMVFPLFLFPKKIEYYRNFMSGGWKEGIRDTMMTWDLCEKHLPWGPFLLLGGGSAMALGTKETGLNAALGEFLDTNQFIASLNKQMILLIAMTIVAIVTSMASNTATAIILAPVLSALALRKAIHPYYLVIGPIISATYAFMFPISTPPNAIAFEAGELRQRDMFLPGFPITIISNAILYFCITIILDPLFNLSSYNGACDVLNSTERSNQFESAHNMILSGAAV